MDFVLLVLGVGVMGIAYILFSKERKNISKKAPNSDEIKELESIIERHFLELQEENHKQNQAYLSDIAFLHKKVNTLEAKLRNLENYKKIDVKIDATNEYEIEAPTQSARYPHRQYVNNNSEYLPIDTESTQDLSNDNSDYDKSDENGIHSQVLILYKQGYSVEEIAKELNIMCGEAQLIIGLHNKNSI
ncbi:DUF6115 domain-containing protein [Desulfuribacillus alkaliarsenatis]|uniref:Uncharacterized protein n=1 Tax=Desulfuribacillus alkaliarsenatis TaxID=766136 RepID=A0A1E5G633_9FIRM|nr:hypothetical protein [Desulfuribacillus alkaliarsenatis]OEF98631.1 hypothetical protein BHF68_02920 [Desulfuribacillus alkaliarsenatis]